MKVRKRDLAFALAVSSSFLLSSVNVDAMLVAGVDFEGSTSSTFDRNPDDLVGGDGITVSTGGSAPQFDGWTLLFHNGSNGASGNLRNDGGATTAGGTTPDFPARLEGNRTGSWSITIDPTFTYDITRIVFDVRGATGGTGRDGQFRTSLEGPTDYLWENFNLPGRSAGWLNVDLDLSSNPTYQGLSGQTIDFIWRTPTSGAIDLDTIQVFAVPTAIPEPSSTLLVALGSIGFLLRRNRK